MGYSSGGSSGGLLTLSGDLALLIHSLVIGTGEGGVVAAAGKTLKAPDIIAGGAGDIPGADLTIEPGRGTGEGDVGQVIFRLPIEAVAGDNLQAIGRRLTLDMLGSSTELRMIAAQALMIAATGDLTLNPTGDVQIDNGAHLQRSTVVNITANTNQTQGDTPLTADINRITICATTGDDVTLPGAKRGMMITVINNGAQTLDVYPGSGDDLGQGANTLQSLTAGSIRTYIGWDVSDFREMSSTIAP